MYTKRINQQANSQEPMKIHLKFNHTMYISD